ncbi:50S ribosomal protein L20 [Candidatus Falkowbacteria bacterium]|nr:50S ribosomal protein L20 [Candidatus Falkowbacteria bacterium]
MPRVKRGVMHQKKKRALRRATKGFSGNRRNTLKLGKTAIKKAGVYAYVGRKLKKRDYRGLWQTRISAAAATEGFSYSRLIGALHQKGIALDRKVLAQLATDYPKIFSAIVAEVKK